ncbi:MAG TPA: hypothetical protein VNG51_01705 [Ktedonobacteraceae bacterium]|nr:hypothetical protein [Ktedonobacteraceae bacterium]
MYNPVYFFEIPIYRVSQEQYGKEVETEKEKLLGPLRNLWNKSSLKPVEESEAYQHIKNNFDREHGTHIWRYNQAIGWLRLFTSDHCHIRIDYYWIKERITKKLKNKNFRYYFEVKTFQLDILPTMTSRDIYLLLKPRIEEIMRKEPFRKYYIDLEPFQHIGPYIDWRALLDADI